MPLALTKTLISRPSVTPDDAGCQQLLAARLQQVGFAVEHLRYGAVSNLWATHGAGSPVLAFLGHTDVVPPGPDALWLSQPFAPQERDGYLYGRGAADMKGSVAAMVVALERFVAAHGSHPGTVALLLTSDEEGAAVDGTRRVVEHLQHKGTRIDWCLVGEPSSAEQLGDVLRNGRRGSLSGALTVLGIQGHTAYPALAVNPIQRALPALTELCARVWDQGDEHYPPTSFQISNIHGGAGAENVTPGSMELCFNLRFSTTWTEQGLKQAIEDLLRRHELEYQLTWRPCSQPFLTRGGKLLEASRAAVTQICGAPPALSAAGGTSDGRFIAPTGAEVVELGPVNATIHKANECVRCADLPRLSEIYQSIIIRLLA